LWLVRRDYYPDTRDEMLTMLDYIE